MKINLLILTLSLLTSVGITQNCFAKSISETAVNRQQSIVLDMQNMTCPLCQLTIKKALQAVKGVETVDIDSNKKTAQITFNTQKTNSEALIKATTDAGYPATVH